MLPALPGRIPPSESHFSGGLTSKSSTAISCNFIMAKIAHDECSWQVMVEASVFTFWSLSVGFKAILLSEVWNLSKACSFPNTLSNSNHSTGESIHTEKQSTGSKESAQVVGSPWPQIKQRKLPISHLPSLHSPSWPFLKQLRASVKRMSLVIDFDCQFQRRRQEGCSLYSVYWSVLSL